MNASQEYLDLMARASKVVDRELRQLMRNARTARLFAEDDGMWPKRESRARSDESAYRKALAKLRLAVERKEKKP